MTSPTQLLETITAKWQDKTFILAYVHSHSCSGLYCKSVKRVDSIREERMQPLPQSRSLSNHCRCFIWLFRLTDGNHFQKPQKGHPKLEGLQGAVVFLKKEGQINVWHAFHSRNVSLRQLYLPAVWMTLQAPVAVLFVFVGRGRVKTSWAS